MINFQDKISPNINLIYGIIFFFCFCNSISSQNKLTDKADVLIGAGRLGHTFPHAMVPFGAVSDGPELETKGRIPDYKSLMANQS